MKDDNKIFSNQTKEKDNEFLIKIETFYDSFVKKGPLSGDITMEQGVILFDSFCEKLDE
jgi:hypothetical protein